MMMHTWNPGPWKAEAKGLYDQGQPSQNPVQITHRGPEIQLNSRTLA